MPQSLSNLLVHLVFSTKDRRPWLRSPELQIALHRELASISQQLSCDPVRVGGFEDHVHLLGRQARTISLAEWVKELKRVSSIWIKKQDVALKSFQWQVGYGAFSVSQSLSPKVQAYIAGQESHHRQMTFQDELRGLLVRHQVEFDERYVWD
jgi:putative transposase